MFKPVYGFEDYMINASGTEILNKDFKSISFYTDRYGYKCATLRNKGIKKNKTIHSLVMETFVMKRPFDMQINHIDGDKTNNDVSNLEYVTASENLKHAYKTGLKCALGEKNGQAKLTAKDVKEIKSLFGVISQSKIAKKFNIDQSTVSNIKTGKLWSHVK